MAIPILSSKRSFFGNLAVNKPWRASLGHNPEIWPFKDVGFIGFGGDSAMLSRVTAGRAAPGFGTLDFQFRLRLQKASDHFIHFIKYPEHVRDRHTGLRSGSGAEHSVNIGDLKNVF